MPRRAFFVAAVVLAMAGCRSGAAPEAKVQDAATSTAAHKPPASPPAEPPPDPALANTLLGGERGLDHVGIGVRDLEAATRLYHEVLGFSRPVEGRLPNGIRNVNYYFADSSYLETMVPWDRARAPWLAEFTDKHSGGLFLVLAARSPEMTTAFLSRRGVAIAAVYDGRIEVKGLPDGGAGGVDQTWKTFFLPDGLLGGDPLYFIAYPRGPRQEFLHKLETREARRQLYHENTALGLRAVWIAVPDLDAATRAYESIGLARRAAFVDPLLGARCQALEAGAGEIRLCAEAKGAAKGAAKGVNQPGAVKAFLDERGKPGVLGVTLMAGSIPAAQRLLADRLKTLITTYEGPYGNSFRLPPERTMGIWLEFAQHLSARAQTPGATRD